MVQPWPPPCESATCLVREITDIIVSMVLTMEILG